MVRICLIPKYYSRAYFRNRRTYTLSRIDVNRVSFKRAPSAVQKSSPKYYYDGAISHYNFMFVFFFETLIADACYANANNCLSHRNIILSVGIFHIVNSML